MNNPILIGIAGAKGAGKDTTADFIREFAESLVPAPSVCQHSFAEKLKLSFARQFFPDINLEDAIAWVDKYKNSNQYLRVPDQLTSSPSGEKYVNFRDAIANYGTDSHRDVFGKNFWLDQLLPEYKSGYKCPEWCDNFTIEEKFGSAVVSNPIDSKCADICLIPDLRFENEMNRIHDLGGQCWKVRRKESEDIVVAEAKGSGREIHRSELGMPDDMFDVVLCNDDNDMDLARKRTFKAIGRILI
jgi:hypothetical protein